MVKIDLKSIRNLYEIELTIFSVFLSIKAHFTKYIHPKKDIINSSKTALKHLKIKSKFTLNYVDSIS